MFETFHTKNKTKGEFHMNSKKSSFFLAQAGLIAALYVCLSLLSNMMGMANGIIQVRLSEALTILPIFTPAAIPGLFVGCLLSNLLTGCLPLDIIFGSLATLLGAFGTYLLKKRKRLALIPPILSNTIIVPLILMYVYRFEGGLPFFMLTVGIGEIISCGVLGFFLYEIINKYHLYKIFYYS